MQKKLLIIRARGSINRRAIIATGSVVNMNVTANNLVYGTPIKLKNK